MVVGRMVDGALQVIITTTTPVECSPEPAALFVNPSLSTPVLRSLSVTVTAKVTSWLCKAETVVAVVMQCSVVGKSPDSTGV